VGKTRKLP